MSDARQDLAQQVTIGAESRRFLARPAEECGTTIVERSNGGSYRRCRPVVRGPADPTLLRLLQGRVEEEATPPPARVVILRDATVRGPGIITLPDDTIVRESLINCKHVQSICDLRRLEEFVFASEPAFSEGRLMVDAKYVLLKQRWDDNYGHWLVEGLPRVALLAGAMDLAECKFLVSAARPAMHRVYVDSLAAFGIREDQIVVSGPDPQYFKQLIYPLPLTIQPWIKAPFAVQVLEEMAGRILAQRGRPWHADRIFVRRPHNSQRLLRNQDEIADLLRRRGYAVVTPALMSFDEQVIAFSEVRRVVGTLGAECASLAYAQTGARYLGLAPERMQDDFFYDLISLKLGRYFCLHGASEDRRAGMNSPFSIDMAAFKVMLEEFEAD